MSSSALLCVALFALAEVLVLHAPARAQEPGTTAWKELQQHPNSWPPQVKLKVDVSLVIMRNGQQAGRINAPADSMVQLLSVDDTALRVGVGSAEGSISPRQTDLAERLAAMPATAAAPVPIAPATTPPPAPAPSVPAPQPAAPTAPLLSGAPLEFDYEAPEDFGGYRRAAFRFWSPAYAQPLRGLIVLNPGNNGDARDWTHDAAWQALVRQYGLGLVGTCMQGGSYQRPERGTGEAFRNALRRFSQETGHPEIVTLPLLLWGESAGGQWDYNYMLWRPEDVMAFVVNKGGYYNMDEVSSRALSTPGLFIVGQADADFRIKAITSIWTAGRKAGALWALAPQPGSGHEFSKTEPLGLVFFDSVLKARLPDSSGLSADSTDSPPLKPMQENAGWLGDLSSHEIHDDATDAEPDRHAAWLPDQATAQAWKVFVSGG